RAGVQVTIGEPVLDASGNATGALRRAQYTETSAVARILAADVEAADGTVLLEKGHDVTDADVNNLIAQGVETIKVRSVLTCATPTGVCASCYGRSMATG